MDRQLTVRELIAFLETCPGGALVFADACRVDGVELTGDPPNVRLLINKCACRFPHTGGTIRQTDPNCPQHGTKETPYDRNQTLGHERRHLP